MLRNLDLDLEGVSTSWVAPEVEVGVPRRRSDRDQRLRDICHRQAELPRAITVDLDIDGWVVERLRILEVAQERQLRKLRPHLLCKRSADRQIGGLHGDF